jgi:gliding motility-associated-like protein
MSKALLLITACFFSQILSAQVAAPVLAGQYSNGGSNLEYIFDMNAAPDGGFIACGSTASHDGDLSGNYGYNDAWVIKYDGSGNKQWSKNYGGSDNESFVSIKAVPAGGYIALGSTNSVNGDVNGLHGLADLWIVRLDVTGNIIRQKCLGGSQIEVPGSVSVSSNGNFVIGASTFSDDGDITDYHVNYEGYSDCWVTVLDPNGNMLMSHCYGGNKGESPGHCEQIPGGGYILTCYTFSNDQDISGNNNGDVWIARLNANGTIVWGNCIGGNQAEVPNCIIPVADGYAIAGYTFSTDNGINNHGSADGWVLKTDLNGNLRWQQAFGGLKDDFFNKMIATRDGGFLALGESFSSDGTNCINHGERDFFLVRIDNRGNMIWHRTYGGTDLDRAFGAVEMPDGSFYINGFTTSRDGDINGNHATYDSWLIHLTLTGVATQATVSISGTTQALCPGKLMQFVATPVNEGLTPRYEWYINHILQVGDTASVFSTTALQPGDSIYCILISNERCLDIPRAESNHIAANINISAAPADFLPPSTNKCDYTQLILSATRSYSAYLWSTGETSSGITVINAGDYWLEVTDTNGCKGKAAIKIGVKDCPHGIFFPTAFTPNNDGRNDKFKPVLYLLTDYFEFSVYNRWGQRIFYTNEPGTGWDGKLGNTEEAPGVYVWTCTYQIKGEKRKSQGGSLMLIR